MTTESATRREDEGRRTGELPESESSSSSSKTSNGDKPKLEK